MNTLNKGNPSIKGALKGPFSIILLVPTSLYERQDGWLVPNVFVFWRFHSSLRTTGHTVGWRSTPLILLSILQCQYRFSNNHNKNGSVKCQKLFKTQEEHLKLLLWAHPKGMNGGKSFWSTFTPAISRGWRVTSTASSDMKPFFVSRNKFTVNSYRTCHYVVNT